MDDYSFDFSDFKPLAKAIMDLEYSSCANCGAVVPEGFERCYECEFHKKYAASKFNKIQYDISEALCLLD